jgi:hypothetical protein
VPGLAAPAAQVGAEALQALLAALPGLTSLDIQKNWDFTDDALRRALPLMTGLQALDLRGTWVGGRAAVWRCGARGPQQLPGRPAFQARRDSGRGGVPRARPRSAAAAAC